MRSQRPESFAACVVAESAADARGLLTGSPISVEAPLWERLRSDVLRWLRRRVAQLQDAEDLAAETIARAWNHFRGIAASWGRVRAWAIRVARNLLRNQLRAARKSVVLLSALLEVLPATTASQQVRLDLGSLLQKLREVLRRPERDTLACLEAGMLEVSDLAISRGVGLRAARKGLARLRAAARRLLGNDCLPVPFSASQVCYLHERPTDS